jgi:hypothetical protein
VSIIRSATGTVAVAIGAGDVGLEWVQAVAMLIAASRTTLVVFMGLSLCCLSALAAGASLASGAAFELTVTSMEQVRNRHAEKVGNAVEVFDPPVATTGQQVADLALRGLQLLSKGCLCSSREPQQFIDIRGQSRLSAFVGHAPSLPY